MTGQMTNTHTYNAMLQLTSVYANSSSGLVNVTYNYSSTQNNGKIASQTDNVSGEQVVYAYDALNRLASAAATSGTWGQSYTYDGFGNLTAQNVTAGSAPAYSVVPDPTTNHLGSVDANGNTLGMVDPARIRRSLPSTTTWRIGSSAREPRFLTTVDMNTPTLPATSVSGAEISGRMAAAPRC